MITYIHFTLLACAGEQMYQKQMYPSNATCANWFICRYQTTISVYIYLIWTQCNQQCDQKHWYTHIYITGICPLNKYAFHIVHICFTSLPLQSTYRPHSTLHIREKATNCNCYLPCSIHMLPAINMPLKCHKYMPNISITSCANMRQLCPYIYIYTSYKLTAINKYDQVHKYTCIPH